MVNLGLVGFFARGCLCLSDADDECCGVPMPLALLAGLAFGAVAGIAVMAMIDAAPARATISPS
jgi:hypothetical protein